MSWREDCGHHYFWMDVHTGFGEDMELSIPILAPTREQEEVLIYAIAAALDMPDNARNYALSLLDREGPIAFFKRKDAAVIRATNMGNMGFYAVGFKHSIIQARKIIDKELAKGNPQ